MYGKYINNILYVINESKDGWKPFVFINAPETQSGYHVAYFWRETESNFEQVWEIIEDFEDDLNDTEALSILLGGNN